MPKTITIPLELAEKILEGLDMAGNEGFPLDTEKELKHRVEAMH